MARPIVYSRVASHSAESAVARGKACAPWIFDRINLNLAYRWLCRLGITDQLRDHSTLSKNRHGRLRELEAFRFVFEQVIKRCIEDVLIGGEGLAVGVSAMEADAGRQRQHDDVTIRNVPVK